MTDRTAVVKAAEEVCGFVSVTVGGQPFGVPVLRVQDVIAGGRIDPVPLAPPEVAGSLNLRGRIVTAVDMRVRLQLARRAPGERFMSVIVEREGELYALLVDDVGDVLWLPADRNEGAPVNVPVQWRELIEGLYQLEHELLLVLSIDSALRLTEATALAAA